MRNFPVRQSFASPDLNNSRLGFTVVNSSARDKPQGLLHPELSSCENVLMMLNFAGELQFLQFTRFASPNPRLGYERQRGRVITNGEVGSYQLLSGLRQKNNKETKK